MKRSKLIGCLGSVLVIAPVFSLTSLTCCKNEPKITEIIITGPEEVPAENEAVQFTAEVISKGGRSISRSGMNDYWSRWYRSTNR